MARTVLCAATQGLPAAVARSHRPAAANGPVGAAKLRLSGGEKYIAFPAFPAMMAEKNALSPRIGDNALLDIF
jgi:hypothetical protein